jgi:hypothetical protein
MNQPSPLTSAYLRFLQLINTLEALPGLHELAANEKALFDSILLYWSRGKPLTVRLAIGQDYLGSPATLHKRLKRLIAKDLILTRYEGGDKRTKYLEPSEKGLAYVEWLDKKMLTAHAGDWAGNQR